MLILFSFFYVFSGTSEAGADVSDLHGDTQEDDGGDGLSASLLRRVRLDFAAARSKGVSYMSIQMLLEVQDCSSLSLTNFLSHTPLLIVVGATYGKTSIWTR